MYFKKALSIALKNRSDLKYEGDGSFDDVVKFLKDNDVAFTNPEGEPIKLTKGITISVSRNEGPADEVTVEDGSAPDEAEGEAMDGEEDDEEVAKSRRARQVKPKGSHKMADLLAAGRAPSVAGGSEAARMEKRYDALVRNGRGTKHHSRAVFNSGGDSLRFGALFRYQANKGRDYAARSFDRDIIGKATATTIDNALGGSLMAVEEYRTELIDLLSDYGACRQLLTFVPSTGKPIRMSRKTSDISSYWAVEAGTVTESNVEVDSVVLVPQKLMALADISNDLLEFADYDIADLYASSAMRELARKEDEAYFNGDGTSTYGNIVGLKNALDATAITAATGTTFSTVVDADVNSAISKLLPKALTSGRLQWSMTPNAYHSVFPRIYKGLGGTDAAQGEGFSGGNRVGGYPVVFNNVTLAATATNTIFAYVGDHNMAAKACEVRGSFSIEFDSSNQFKNDITTMRVKEYVDINIHDSGSSAGVDSPVVALKTGS